MSKRRWIIRDKMPADFTSQLPDLPMSLLQVLYNRGIRDKEEIVSFLRPVYDNQIYNPLLLPDMEKGVERVLEAINKKQKITVYADYDADAVTAAAVMIRTLKELGLDVDYYIPDRFDEGYGLNSEAIKEISRRGTELIITVDCGITAVDEAHLASEMGIEMIITDHHHVPENLPRALAVINPHRQDSVYPFRDLTGVGVAFKFVQGLLTRLRQDPVNLIRHDSAALQDGWEKWLLDLVAIGTVADCQSLLGENRVLVKYGLFVLSKTRWQGLRALLEVSGLDGTKNSSSRFRSLNSEAIGFIIAPRINAAGRIAHADLALKLLLTDDELVAGDLALRIEKLNRQRQQMTEGVVSEAREQIENQKKNKILFAASPGWSKGVVGLVAGKLADEFHRPVLIASREQIYATGSARSIPGFNIIEALSFAGEHMLRYGGHAAAAGFTVANEKLSVFYNTLREYAEHNLVESNLEPALYIDAVLESSLDLSLDVVENLEKLQPFGQNNHKPVFAIHNLKVVSVRSIGSDSKHAQILCLFPQMMGMKVRCIAFGHGYLAKALKPGDFIDLAGELIINDWNGSKNVEIKLIDWRRVE